MLILMIIQSISDIASEYVVKMDLDFVLLLIIFLFLYEISLIK